MSMSKDLFMEAQEALFEEKQAELVAGGMSEEEADEVAAEWVESNAGCDQAMDRSRDMMADKIDHVRQLRKDGML